MSSRASIGRHRAPASSPLATIAKAVSSNAGGVGRQAAVVATASGLVFSVGVVPAQATADREAKPLTEVTGLIFVDSITVPADLNVSFERAAIRSAPAPETAQITAQPQEAAQLAAQQTDRAAAQAAPAAPEETASAAVEEPPTEPAAEAPAASSVAAGIASAAYAQLGVNQDCTMLVTNALSAVGISHHGWPDSYFALGTTISASAAQPGDLVYYADGGVGLAHIAVYVGNGQAIHGGWYGTTELDSVNVGSGPVFIRVNG